MCEGVRGGGYIGRGLRVEGATGRPLLVRDMVAGALRPIVLRMAPPVLLNSRGRPSRTLTRQHASSDYGRIRDGMTGRDEQSSSQCQSGAATGRLQ